MLNIFLEGFLLGLGAAVPLGPINILIINYALKNYLNAFFIGIGAMSADIIYLLMMSYGVLKIFNNPYFLKALCIFGFLFLTFMAFLIFKGARKNIETQKVIEKTFILKSFSKGFFLTLANPYTVGFWISIASIASFKVEGFKLLIFGLILAIFLWISVMPYIIFSKKHLITIKAISFFAYFSASVLLFFALTLLVNLFR